MCAWSWQRKTLVQRTYLRFLLFHSFHVRTCTINQFHYPWYLWSFIVASVPVAILNLHKWWNLAHSGYRNTPFTGLLIRSETGSQKEVWSRICLRGLEEISQDEADTWVQATSWRVCHRVMDSIRGQWDKPLRKRCWARFLDLDVCRQGPKLRDAEVAVQLATCLGVSSDHGSQSRSNTATLRVPCVFLWGSIHRWGRVPSHPPERASSLES